MTSQKNEEWAAYVRDLGVALLRRRHELGLSQERTANAAGLTRGYYQQLERGASRTGRMANPTIQNLIALAQVLGTTAAELLPSDPPDMTAGRYYDQPRQPHARQPPHRLRLKPSGVTVTHPARHPLVRVFRLKQTVRVDTRRRSRTGASDVPARVLVVLVVIAAALFVVTGIVVAVRTMFGFY